MCVWEGERSCWLKNLLIVVVELILLIVDRYWWWCNGFLFFLFLYLILSISIDEVGWLQATLSLSFSFSPSNSLHIEERKLRFIFVLGYKQHDGHTTWWYPVHIHVHCSHAASLGQLFEIQLFWNSDHCQYYILIIFIWWPSRMQDWHEGLVICIFSSLEKLMWHCIKYHQACGLYTFSKWSLASAAKYNCI